MKKNWLFPDSIAFMWSSENISKDFDQFKNIFSSLSNLSEEAIYKVVQSKIIDIAYELAGYQIDKMPEKYKRL